MSTLQGTTIKNTGYLDKVYFNTSIPTEEVIAVLEKLDLSKDYFVCTRLAAPQISIWIRKRESYYSIICQSTPYIDMPFNTDPYYVNEDWGIVKTGWKKSFDNEGFGNPFEFNEELSSTDSNGNTVGLQNELLKNLISSTPFGTPTLDEFLTDIADSIRYVKGNEEKVNAQNFSSEIRKFKGGSGENNGSNGSGGSGETDGYKIRYLDIDGTVLKTEYVAEGGKLTPPNNPSYDSDYLEFNTWNYDIENYVVERDTDVGAIYRTKTGDTYLFIKLTESIGLTIPSMKISGVTSIDWGDGTVDTNLTHNYADYGDYVIKISGMTSITNYLFGSSSSVYTYCLQKCYLGDSVTRIKTYAFRGCSSLTSITIPNSVISIEPSAFYNCYALTSIAIPNSVTSIGGSTFYSCYNLTSITIPESVNKIESSLLRNCYNLTSITIPESVTSIGNEAFYDCRSLTSIVIPESVTSIGTYTLYNCYNLTSITIPDGVTSIGNYAFQNCYNLTSITIPESVTSIGTYAISSCYRLTNITIPEGVTSIGGSMFYNCYALTSITIPESVTSISDGAFSNCYTIKNYIFNCNSVPTLSNTNVFNNINKSAIIWVKDELVDAYKSASNWSTYATYMKPLSWYPSLTNPNA
jgi:hypothetical protein